MNILKKISYIFFVVLLGVIGNQHVEAQTVGAPGQCEISDIFFSPLHGTGDTEFTLTLEQGHADCAIDKTEFNLEITESGDVVDLDIYDADHRFHSNGEAFELTFKTNNYKCDNNSSNTCNYFVNILVKNKQGTTITPTSSKLVPNNISYSSDYDSGDQTADFFDTAAKLSRARIITPCTNCKKGENIEIISVENDYNDSSQVCRVTSVEFSPYGQNIEPNFLKSNLQEPLELEIVTENCIGSEVSEKMKIQILTLTSDRFNVNEVEEEADVSGTIPPDGIVNVIYKPGDEECDEILNSKEYCNYGVVIYNSLLTDNSKKMYVSPEGSVENKKDKIGYYCDGDCEDEWGVLSTNLLDNNITNAEIVEIGKKFDSSSPCYQINKVGEESYLQDCYEPLASLPGTGDTVFNTDKETGRQYINFKDFEIGDYVNFLFKTALGVLMVLAVIMIIIAGVQYMTEESIYGKSNARSRITNAVTGLLVALGIFTVLSTINPELLNVNFTPPSVKINFESESGDGFISFSTPPEGYPLLGDISTDGSYKPVGCPEGIVLINNIHICTSMADKLENLMEAAEKDGYRLSGGGFRSAAQQIWLRAKNCQPNPDTKPSGQCTPKTARPGRSNHEAGLAVDFRCNAKPMRGDCLQWMKLNAGAYGFINLPSEPWHWSHNGR